MTDILNRSGVLRIIDGTKSYAYETPLNYLVEIGIHKNELELNDYGNGYIVMTNTSAQTLPNLTLASGDVSGIFIKTNGDTTLTLGSKVFNVLGSSTRIGVAHIEAVDLLSGSNSVQASSGVAIEYIQWNRGQATYDDPLIREQNK